MEHSAYKEMLSALLDGELHGAEREAALAHMDGCADCRAYFAELTALRSALGDLEKIDAPEDFAAGVMTRLRAEDAHSRPRAGSAPKTRKIPPARRGYAALAACAAVVLLAVYALPNALRMGGGAARDSAVQAAPAETSGAPAAPATAPQEPAAPASEPAYDYAYAGGAGGAPESVSEGPGIADADLPASIEDRAAEGAAENGAMNGETYSAATTAAESGEKLSSAGMDEAPIAPMSRAEVYGEEFPVLTLSGEGAESWLAEHGWRGESGAWYAGAPALRALPDGLILSDGELPEDYDGAVLVELWEAEP